MKIVIDITEDERVRPQQTSITTDFQENERARRRK